MGILAASISLGDRILFMNLSSTTTAITFVAWRRLVFSSNSPSSPHHIPSFFSLVLFPSILRLATSPFAHLSILLRLPLDISSSPLSLSLSLSHSRPLFICLLSVSFLEPVRGRAGPFATKNNARAKMTRQVGTHSGNDSLRIHSTVDFPGSLHDVARNSAMRE